jgi:hypothetical protein
MIALFMVFPFVGCEIAPRMPVGDPRVVQGYRMLGANQTRCVDLNGLPGVDVGRDGAQMGQPLEDAGLGDLQDVGDLVGLEVRQGAEHGLLVAASDVHTIQSDHVQVRGEAHVARAALDDRE